MLANKNKHLLLLSVIAVRWYVHSNIYCVLFGLSNFSAGEEATQWTNKSILFTKSKLCHYTTKTDFSSPATLTAALPASMASVDTLLVPSTYFREIFKKRGFPNKQINFQSLTLKNPLHLSIYTFINSRSWK